MEHKVFHEPILQSNIKTTVHLFTEIRSSGNGDTKQDFVLPKYMVGVPNENGGLQEKEDQYAK